MNGIGWITLVVVPLAGLVIGLLQLREARKATPALKGPAKGAAKKPRFLSYDVGALSRLYAHDPLVVVGYPYATLKRWSIADKSVEMGPFGVRVDAQKFSIQSDRPEGWREVSDLAYGALQNDGHDITRSEVLVRVTSFDERSQTLVVQKAEYNDQRRSNLVLDYEVPGRSTLRQMLATEYGKRLPALADGRLANTLGIAILVILEEGSQLSGYCVRRPKKGVAVFQDTWSCSASGAAKWPSHDDEGSFYAGLVDDVLEELEEEVGLVNSDLTFLMPAALSRELVRGGKPELFFLAGSRLSRAELKKKRAAALRLAAKTTQPQEVVSDGLLSSAAWFPDIESDPSAFYGPKIANQASFLLSEAARQAGDIRASFRR